MMKRIRNFADGLWSERHLAEWMTDAIVAVNLFLAAVILAGGVTRFSPPSFNPLIDYSHGHTWIWAVWIAASALLMSAPFKWPNVIGFWLSMCWHIIWMACFTIALLHYPTAAATFLPLHGGMALFSTILLTARVLDNKKE